MNDIALNHRVAPLAGLEEFFDLASALGVTKVEIRNDLPGRPIADGMSPVEVRRQAEARGLTILSINALYPFNIWTDRMAAQARALIGIAAECGAQAIVMCPLNEASAATDAERAAGLRQSLEQLAPMLRAAGVIGLVEPLGFPECSLRFKREAVEAIDAVGGDDVFQLVHDTFHHHVAGETDMFPRPDRARAHLRRHRSGRGRGAACGTRIACWSTPTTGSTISARSATSWRAAMPARSPSSPSPTACPTRPTSAAPCPTASPSSGRRSARRR